MARGTTQSTTLTAARPVVTRPGATAADHGVVALTATTLLKHLSAVEDAGAIEKRSGRVSLPRVGSRIWVGARV